MLGGRCRALLLAGLLSFLVPTAPLKAVNPETLLMPGKLSAAHAKFEEKCSSCHDRSDRNRQTQLCIACHKEIAGDLRERRGFHGRIAGIEHSQCRACHSEHTGREADIVKFSREQFDHANSDFQLRGAHAYTPCASCHAAGKPYRDAPSECVACHRKEEPHEGKLGRNCGSCHDAVTWQHVTYDHDKTAFALHDKHAHVPCAACHWPWAGWRSDPSPTRSPTPGCVRC